MNSNQNGARESREWLLKKLSQIEAHRQETNQNRQIQDIDDEFINRSRGFYEETLTDVYWQYTHLLSHTRLIHTLTQMHICLEGGGQNAKEVCKKFFVKPS